MEYAELGPFMVYLKDGTTRAVKYFDGGGAFVGTENYEVHGEQIEQKDPFFCVFQRDIVKVLDKNGDPFIHFGNAYFPDHPYNQEYREWLERERTSERPTTREPTR